MKSKVDVAVEEILAAIKQACALLSRFEHLDVLTELEGELALLKSAARTNRG